MRIEGDPDPHEGRLVRVSPEVDARSRTLLVEAEFVNADGALRPGAFASADLIVDAAAKARVVPDAALVRFAGVDRVFVVKDGVAVEKRVLVGRIEGGRIEILDGVDGGEQVVLEPGSLRSGAKVRAVE
jgi:RND family efflux transporter MFP subunit